MTNAIFETTPTISSGTLQDGTIANITESNFSRNARVSPSGLTLSIDFGAVTCSYLALHGLLFGSAGRGTSITSRVYDGATLIKEFQTNSGYSDIMFTFDLRTFSNLRITILGNFSDLTISYCAAGRSTIVPHKGAQPGRALDYLNFDQSVTGSRSISARPISQKLRTKASKVSLSLSNMPIEWAREDYKRVLDLYKETGIVSVIDFEDENHPTECWAGFELSSKAKTYNGTRRLVAINMSFNSSSNYGVYY